MSNSSRRSAIDDFDEEERALARWRAASAPPADWPEIDAGLLDDGRGAVPRYGEAVADDNDQQTERHDGKHIALHHTRIWTSRARAR